MIKAELPATTSSGPLNSASQIDLRFYLDKIESIGRTLGFNFPPARPEVFHAFSQLAEAKQAEVLRILKNTCEIYAGLESEAVSNREITLKHEIKMLKNAIARFDLEIVDQDIFECIADGDVVEIYTGLGIQIYRSWSFFKICSYSLVELLVYDWNTLYERPLSIVNSLFEKAPLLFQPGATTMSYNLPEYLLIERYLSRKRALKVHMKLASPLKSKTSGEIEAFISTASTVLLPLTENSASLNFI